MVALAALAGAIPVRLNAQSLPGTEPDSFVERFIRMPYNRWVVSNGWSNGPQQGCVWSLDNVRIDHGAMDLLLSGGPGAGDKWLCAELQSKDFYRYGTYEIRLRSIAGSGIITSFFLYTGPIHGEGRQQQQIGVEFPGRSPRSMEINYFAEGKKQFHKTVSLDFDASRTVNDYAFEWLPDSVRWYVNGRVVDEELRQAGRPMPTWPSKLVFTVWNGTSSVETWLGPFDGDKVSYDAVAERIAFTQPGKPCLFGQSVACMQPK
jgi:endo-1,3-1,4-beta-glycanase ExoK